MLIALSPAIGQNDPKLVAGWARAFAPEGERFPQRTEGCGETAREVRPGA